MERQEELEKEFSIVNVKKHQEMPNLLENMSSQWETIIKAFRFGKLGIIIFSLIICLQMPGNTSFKSKLAIVLLKIIQYIFFRVLGVKIKSSEYALKLIETFYYKTERICDDTLNKMNLKVKEEAILDNLRKKLIM